MDTLKVKVTGPHTHEGREIPVGEVIELPAKIARIMCSVWKTGELVEEPKKASKKRAAKDS